VTHRENKAGVRISVPTVMQLQPRPDLLGAVLATDPVAAAALPTPDSFEFFTRTQRDRAPAWENQVTLRSVELLQGYEPGRFLPLIAPTPLQMVVAPNDRLVAGELATAAFEQAAHPKKLVTVPGGHFDAYTGTGFEISSAAARDWFAEHLLAGKS
jgi:hypothetical protein